ncbi:YcnI family protein [Streptomyces sp. NPDC057638]|uniref:YcnI family protein n=1 Tax=Streptomyces sp. NPDC057638 TaxID=3346190 RepID=UPI00369BEF36
MSLSPFARRPFAVRALTVAAGTAAAGLLLSGPAFAHVSVQPQGEAAQGGYATVLFKVPNERDNASTVKLEVTLPTAHPLASVLPQAVPGWKATVTRAPLAKPLEVHGEKITEAVTKVTWTSAGAKVEPGQFQQFPLSIGQLPENADRLVFKALQTYDNKEVVRWIEEPTKGTPEPQSPAPVLELAPADGGHHGTGTGTADAKDATKDAKDTAAGSTHDQGAAHGDTKAAETSAGGSDTTARILAVVGILVGAAGVAFGVLARRRTS